MNFIYLALLAFVASTRAFSSDISCEKTLYSQLTNVIRKVNLTYNSDSSDKIEKEKNISELRSLLEICPVPSFYYFTFKHLFIARDPFNSIEDVFNFLGLKSHLSDYVSIQQPRSLFVASKEEAFHLRFPTLVFTSANRHGTFFYLGKAGSKYIFGTNNHVISEQNDCSQRFWLMNDYHARVFSLTDFYLFICRKIVYTNKDIDFTLFTADLGKAHQDNKDIIQYFENHKLQFNFKDPFPEHSSRLMTAGWGIYRLKKLNIDQEQDKRNQPWYRLYPTLKMNSKCVSLSSEAKYRADFDYVSKVKIWSSPYTCIASPGDSGSPVIDSQSQKIVGVTSTTADIKLLREDIPKPNDPRIWEDFSYAVPALKIREYLDQVIADKKLDEESLSVILQVLNEGKK